jgi:putative aldouronate transport system permease protein
VKKGFGKMSTINKKREEPLFDVLNGFILILFSILMLYPFVYTINLSLSDADMAMAGGFFLTPAGFDIGSYKSVFSSPFIISGYGNSLFVTIVGTIIQLMVTALFAYPLSRKQLKGRALFNKMVIFTMMFNGGLIPTFLVVRATGLLNNLFALIIPVLISPFNVIILRSFFSNIPDSLEESAKIDGANDLHVFFQIILPLSKAAMATIGLWCAVALWNNFFNCLIYIKDREKYVLQLILREIVQSANLNELMDVEGDDVMMATPETIKAATIMVVTLPILCVYPFIQKHFVKGVMIGSVKG